MMVNIPLQAYWREECSTTAANPRMERHFVRNRVTGTGCLEEEVSRDLLPCPDACADSAYPNP